MSDIGQHNLLIFSHPIAISSGHFQHFVVSQKAGSTFNYLEDEVTDTLSYIL